MAAGAVVALCSCAQHASLAALDQGLGLPDLATQVAMLLFTCLLDELSDTGYVGNMSTILKVIQVRCHARAGWLMCGCCLTLSKSTTGTAIYLCSL
jgi:hypothetical protein